jgi:hypothetical protein
VVGWHARLGGSANGSARLRVLHPDPAQAGNYIASASSLFARVTHNTVADVAVRVPIKAGDRFALQLPPDDASNPGPAIGYAATTGGQSKAFSPVPADGASFTPLSIGDDNKELLFNAVIEADQDGDGYGDETQDACPTDPDAHAAPCGFRLGPYDVSVASNSALLCSLTSTCMLWQGTAPTAGGHLATAPSDGVIVRWRGRFAGTVSAQVRLRRLEPTASPGAVVGRGTSEPFAVTGSTSAQTFATRFPIYAGQQLGIDMPQGTASGSLSLNNVAATGGSVKSAAPQFPDQASPTNPPSTVVDTELLLNADVEPDADGDGYGDRTQDACPTDPGPEPCDAVATIGAPDIARYSGLSIGCGPGAGTCTFWEGTSAPNRRWAAPFDGVVVRWRVRYPVAANTVRLRVLQPGSPTAVRSSDYATTSTTTAPQTFASRLPVKAGDLIGLDLPDNGAAGGLNTVNTPGGTLKKLRPSPADGAAFGPPSVSFPGYEALFNADIEPDADGDGFGDVTQDGCPGVTGTAGGCVPAPVVTPAGGGTVVDARGPSVKIARKAVVMTRKGVVAVKLSCPKSEPAGCVNGLLTLVTARKVTFARNKKVTLGSKRFAIAAGKSLLVKVKLSAKNRRGVIQKKHLLVLAQAAADDQAHNRLVTPATFTLKAPRPKH